MGGLIFKPVELACTVAYPAWQTYKSLEHADKHGGEVVIRQQLMYWLIFAMIHIVDSLFGFILQWASFGPMHPALAAHARAHARAHAHAHACTETLTCRRHTEAPAHSTHTHTHAHMHAHAHAHVDVSMNVRASTRAATSRSSPGTLEPHPQHPQHPQHLSTSTPQS